MGSRPLGPRRNGCAACASKLPVEHNRKKDIKYLEGDMPNYHIFRTKYTLL